MTKTVTATIGWTKSDLPRYSSFDGYQPGEQQHEETISFVVPASYDAERICWVLMTMTNAPYPSTPAERSALEALRSTGYRGEQAHYSLSKGDTVTIDGTKYAFTGYAVEVVEEPTREAFCGLSHGPGGCSDPECPTRKVKV